MKKTHLILAFVLYVILASCEAMVTTQDSNKVVKAEFSLSNNKLNTRHTFEDFTTIDLSSYGFNVVMQAPKNARVIPHKTDLGITVYAGKYFKIQLRQTQGTATENIEMMKLLATDQELNPGFVKLTIDEETGYMKENKSKEQSFVYGINVPGESVIASSGMPYALSPDKFTAYTNNDIALMWKSVKTIKVK